MKAKVAEKNILNTKEAQVLLSAFLSIKNEDELKLFLRDIMTGKEIVEFSKRLQVASMLSQNISYTDIERASGLSSTTVARVSKWLKGSFGGYRIVLDRISHHRKGKKLQRDLS